MNIRISALLAFKGDFKVCCHFFNINLCGLFKYDITEGFSLIHIENSGIYGVYPNVKNKSRFNTRWPLMDHWRFRIVIFDECFDRFPEFN